MFFANISRHASRFYFIAVNYSCEISGGISEGCYTFAMAVILNSGTVIYVFGSIIKKALLLLTSFPGKMSIILRNSSS